MRNYGKKRPRSASMEPEPPKKYLCLYCEGPEEEEEEEKEEEVVYQKFNTDLNTLPELPLINAFDRGYEVEQMLDILKDSHGQFLFVVKFKYLPKPELVPYDEVLKNAYELVEPFHDEYAKYWQLR